MNIYTRISYIYIYIYVYMYICIYMYMHIYNIYYMHICVCIYVCVYMYICVSVVMYVCVCTYMFVCACVCRVFCFCHQTHLNVLINIICIAFIIRMALAKTAMYTTKSALTLAQRRILAEVPFATTRASHHSPCLLYCLPTCLPIFVRRSEHLHLWHFSLPHAHK